MRKVFSILSAAALSLLFFYACNTNNSGQAYTIKMRLNKGDSFQQEMQMNMLMNTAGMEMNMKMNFGLLFNVINSSPEEKEIRFTYNKMHTEIDMGKLPNVNMPDSVVNKSNKYIIGKSVLLKLSGNNEIMSVSGFDEILNNPSQDSATHEMMRKMFSKDQFNSMSGMMFSMYPKKPVKVGDTWTDQTNLNIANMEMKVDNKFTLIAVKNNLAEIGIDGTIKGAGEIMQRSTGMKMDMSGTQKGTITIRMDNGYLHTGSYKIDIKGVMQMMGQKIPMTMKANYDLKGD